MRWLLPALLLVAPLGAQEYSDYDEYRKAKEKVSAQRRELEYWKAALDKALTPEQRERARKYIENAENSVRNTEGMLDDMRLRMKPGGKIWEEETKVEGVEGGATAPPGRSGPAALDEIRTGVPFPQAPTVDGPVGPLPGGDARTAAVGYNLSPTTGEGALFHGGSPIPRPAATRRVAEPLRADGAGGGPVEKDRGSEREPEPGESPESGPQFLRESGPWGFPEPEAGDLLDRIRRALEIGDPETALKEADRLAGLKPSHAGVHHLRALILNRLGRFPDAEGAARRSTGLDPNRAGAHRTLAWALLRQGRYEEALTSASRAVALDPQDASARAVRAFALQKLGKGNEALAEAERAAGLDPARFAGLPARARSGGPLFGGGASSAAPFATAARSRTRSVPAAAAGAAALLVLGGLAAYFLKFRRGSS